MRLLAQVCPVLRLHERGIRVGGAYQVIGHALLTATRSLAVLRSQLRKSEG
jgi:hypothetical protein